MVNFSTAHMRTWCSVHQVTHQGVTWCFGLLRGYLVQKHWKTTGLVYNISSASLNTCERCSGTTLNCFLLGIRMDREHRDSGYFNTDSLPMEISCVISGGGLTRAGRLWFVSPRMIYMRHNVIHLLLCIHKLSGRFGFFFSSSRTVIIQWGSLAKLAVTHI